MPQKRDKKKISDAIVKISIVGITLGLAIMILSVAIVTGFKDKIRTQITGFGSHIIITNFDLNASYETHPISKKQDFYPSITKTKGIKHIQTFATKSGIIKTNTDMQGVVLKGIGTDFDWSFFEKNLVDGKKFTLNDSTRSKRTIISKNLADLLKLKKGDTILTYFIQNPPRYRKFIISGIYETGLEDYDKLFILVDIKHIQRLNNWTKDQISGFEILIDDFDKIKEMTDIVYEIAGFNIGKDGSKLRIRNIKEAQPQIFEWLQLTDTNVWVILILMLTVAGFNMISGLLILILERINMIGVLKAMGAENWLIRKIFLYNAIFLTGRGLLWGNVIGIGLCLIQEHFKVIKLDPASYYINSVPINLEIIPLLLLNLGTMVVILSMLVIPSFIISRVSPVKAIKFN